MSPRLVRESHLFCLALVILLGGCSWHSGEPIPQSPAGPRIRIHADDILARNLAIAQWVEVHRDPVFEATKNFRAIPLATLMRKLGCTNADSEIHIRCMDGYLASLSGSEALDATGFLAFADESSTNSDQSGFSLLKTKTGLVDPAPLYLFWLNDPGNRPRPYQIEEIEIWMTGEALGRAKPVGTAAAQRGFELFRKNCASCHSVNGAGGRLAVDLNFPMNVTEYWKAPALKQLISNPASIRANAKMPAFPQLTERDIQDLISYLRQMQKQKLKP
ncbi:MAG TPA: cytochrome c [Candidatus Dormibacteraeota bacterium]|nr:cytochrome c [Candidatus Dormibacteraeota bacterium]